MSILERNGQAVSGKCKAWYVHGDKGERLRFWAVSLDHARRKGIRRGLNVRKVEPAPDLLTEMAATFQPPSRYEFDDEEVTLDESVLGVRG